MVLKEQSAGLAIWYSDLQHIADNYSNSYDHAPVVIVVLHGSRIEVRGVYFSLEQTVTVAELHGCWQSTSHLPNCF